MNFKKSPSESRFCVYIHKRIDTGVIFYVGIGSPTRPYQKSKRNRHWNNIVAKNNGEFIVEIIGEDLPWTFCCDVERGLIKTYGRIDNGTGILVNMTDGGEGMAGNIPSEATREKMRNRIVSADTRLKQSVIARGRRLSDEAKLKVSIFNKGKKYSEETKQKMSAWQIGRTMPEDAVKNQVISRARKRGYLIEQWDKKTGELLNTFINLRHAQKATRLSLNSISDNINGLVIPYWYIWKKSFDLSKLDELAEHYFPSKISDLS